MHVCSGNIGDNGLALMEAVHGTAPDIAGMVRYPLKRPCANSIIYLRQLDRHVWRVGIITYECTSHPSNIKT